MEYDLEHMNMISKQKSSDYGSFQGNDQTKEMSFSAASSPVKVLYCLHGNPSGSCFITECMVGSSKENYEDRSSETEHCHGEKYEAIDKRARNKLIVASILCVVFMLAEIVGGYLSSSLAIATDAAHLLTDFASFMISLFSLWLSTRPPTRKMSFGWYRAEVMGALVSVLMIWIVTGILLYAAVLRIVYKDFHIDATIMIITSGLGVTVNIIMGCTLHSHGHSHGGSHGHSHAPERDHHGGGEERDNINVRAAFIHVLGDFIQSFGVFVAAITIYFKPEWSIVDPISTFVFAVIVLITTFSLIRDTVLVLMEGRPSNIDFLDVLNTFLEIESVVKVHNLRIWALSMEKTALSAHLAIRPSAIPQVVLTQASQKIQAKYKFFEITLQIEVFDQKMEDCLQCQCPEK